MAQLLVTYENCWYQAIASIRNYSETDFEEKLFKYGNDIFKNFHVLKFKYNIVNSKDRLKKYKPDLLLISNDFTRWIFVEVELCSKSLAHTRKQIECFLNPEYDVSKVVSFLTRHNPKLKEHTKKLTHLISNHAPELLLIYDDYCLKTFDQLKTEFGELKFCVLEVYRTGGHDLEAYRLSGDYPYEISEASKLKSYDFQHYKILRPEILKSYSQEDVEIEYKMKKLKASIFRSKKLTFLKIPGNPFPSDRTIQLKTAKDGKLIIESL